MLLQDNFCVHSKRGQDQTAAHLHGQEAVDWRGGGVDRRLPHADAGVVSVVTAGDTGASGGARGRRVRQEALSVFQEGAQLGVK